jgi:hypothetical protein
MDDEESFNEGDTTQNAIEIEIISDEEEIVGPLYVNHGTKLKVV